LTKPIFSIEAPKLKNQADSPFSKEKIITSLFLIPAGAMLFWFGGIMLPDKTQAGLLELNAYPVDSGYRMAQRLIGFFIAGIPSNV